MARPQTPKSPVDSVPTNAARGRPKSKPAARRVRDNVERPMQIAEVRERGFLTNNNASAALIDVNKPLTEMQKLFVKHWAAGESILSASHRAGYSDSGTSAYRMVRMPNILALYTAEKLAYEAASGMTRKKVMDGLLEGVEMAKLAGEPAAMIAGWREVGKMCGYYEPVVRKVEVTVTGNALQDRLNRLSDAELLKVITEGIVDADGEPG